MVWSAWAYQAEHLKLNNELILQRQRKQVDTDGTFPVKPQDTYEGALSETKNAKGFQRC